MREWDLIENEPGGKNLKRAAKWRPFCCVWIMTINN